MFRPAARAVLQRQLTSQASTTSSRTLFSAVKAKPKKSFKGTLARWALAAGGTYWYMNSNVLAEETKYYKATPPNNIDHWYEDDYTRRMDAQYKEQERLEREVLAAKSAETAAVTQQVATGSPITGATKVDASSTSLPATTNTTTNITATSPSREKKHLKEGTGGVASTDSKTSSTKTDSVSEAEDDHLQTASEAGATRRPGSASETGTKPFPAATHPVSDTTTGHIAQEDAAESHGKTPVEAKLTNPTSPEELEAEANQQGAFNPETGEINWDCPCLGGMAHGPCGEEFKSAFSCFIYSEAEPKGVDCIDKFKHMQDCFRKFPDVYGNELEDDEDAEAGDSGSGDEFGERIDKEIDAAIDEQNNNPSAKPRAPPSTQV